MHSLVTTASMVLPMTSTASMVLPMTSTTSMVLPMTSTASMVLRVMSGVFAVFATTLSRFHTAFMVPITAFNFRKRRSSENRSR